ncbi:uncharacterized protein LOC122251159 [Penaeus japonicus]|uniref:uncharacterized protein LOC122251159 n=1 Tax=Penaeus japonicus TaxID=27405 RepID=UPI001C70FF5E|nr:uncharacterized protein LOC122251159 [Penaeus japonicus]
MISGKLGDGPLPDESDSPMQFLIYVDVTDSLALHRSIYQMSCDDICVVRGCEVYFYQRSDISITQCKILFEVKIDYDIFNGELDVYNFRDFRISSVIESPTLNLRSRNRLNRNSGVDITHLGEGPVSLHPAVTSSSDSGNTRASNNPNLPSLVHAPVLLHLPGLRRRWWRGAAQFFVEDHQETKHLISQEVKQGDDHESVGETKVRLAYITREIRHSAVTSAGVVSEQTSVASAMKLVIVLLSVSALAMGQGAAPTVREEPQQAMPREEPRRLKLGDLPSPFVLKDQPRPVLLRDYPYYYNPYRVHPFNLHNIQNYRIQPKDGSGVALHPGGATSYIHPQVHGLGKRSADPEANYAYSYYHPLHRYGYAGYPYHRFSSLHHMGKRSTEVQAAMPYHSYYRHPFLHPYHRSFDAFPFGRYHGYSYRY